MKNLILILTFAFITVACGNNEETKADSATNSEVSTPKKMKANPETAEGMLMIQHMIISFNEMKEENKNYAVLLGELSYQCDYIIKNCSMKGKNHDELHKVLEPILASIQKAKNAASNEEINQELDSIVSNTELFFERFDSDQSPA